MASPVPINWERRELELPDRLYRSQRILVYALIRALTRYRDFTRDAGEKMLIWFFCPRLEILPDIGIFLQNGLFRCCLNFLLLYYFFVQTVEKGLNFDIPECFIFNYRMPYL
jgi:uncharacterized membrane protein YqaE (UPF0057 family)